MRKIFTCIMVASLLFFMTGCNDTGEKDSPKSSAENGVLEATIVDGSNTGTLLLAGEGKEDVYLLGTAGLSVTVNGKESEASELKDGMDVTVRFDGDVEKTFPMGLNDPTIIEAEMPQKTKDGQAPYFDLCGLYLNVLNDLVDTHPEWNTDEIQYYSFDFTTAPGGLTDAEKTAIGWKFSVDQGKSPLFKGLDTLLEEEYLDLIYIDGVPTEHPELHEWKDGKLFSLKAATGYDDETYPDLHFDASVWQNPEWSTYFSGCEAKWTSPDEAPDYEVIAQLDGIY